MLSVAMADMAHFLQPLDGGNKDDIENDVDIFDRLASGDSDDSEKNSVDSRLLVLPPEILIQIVSSLDARSVCRLGVTCKQLQAVCLEESLWKNLCETEYLLTEDSKGEGWRLLYISYHSRFGRYHSTEIYRTIRRLWTRLENYLQANDPQMLSSLREPCYHGEIKIAEEKLRCRFPADLRCSLQIHNGQENKNGIGLHGCMSIGSYYRSEALVDAATMARHYVADATDGEMPGCVPLTYCMVSRTKEYIAVDEEGSFDVGSVLYRTNHGNSAGVFYAAKSYTEWFQDLVESVESMFPRIDDNMMFRFVSDPECVARSHDCYQVNVATCFMPDISTTAPPSYMHVYRITMSMDENAPRKMSCQLTTRHWIITDETGKEEYVDGPGVVGEYPIMKPGETFSWISCCTLPTTYGNMRGRFDMKNLETDEEITIECPVFHMKCLPHEDYTEAMVRLVRKKKLS